MKDTIKTIKVLNELLQGEYMAVESFNNFISKVEDEKIKTEFQRIQQQHRSNIEKLATYIQNLGGQPDENLGFKGKMGDLKVNMDLGFKTDDGEILKKAIEGETRGVNMAEKILRGNLDDKSRDVVGEILQKDRVAIRKLKTLAEQKCVCSVNLRG
ncbi:MAG TPA: PA2169 family four-helix-bundle protein [Thermoanaerobacterales bacterium]|nr:PA2169 family four-helix-bundle protein [Thermoanaerobacterales bacterium]